MDLQNLIQDRASASAKFMGETLSFKYRPAMITAEIFQQLDALNDVDEITTFFCDIIVAWDLEQNGRPLEVAKENIRKLPMQLLKGIIQAIINDVPQADSGKA